MPALTPTLAGHREESLLSAPVLLVLTVVAVRSLFDTPRREHPGRCSGVPARPGRFVSHCHNSSHEDVDMMGQFDVQPNP